MAENDTVGFIGLGVMGEPMCRNLLGKSGRRVLCHDLRPEPCARLAAEGAEAAGPEEIARRAGVVLLSLPGEPQLRRVCLGEGGLIAAMGRGQTLVDCSTAPPGLARELAAAAAERDVAFADAPVARTAQAAIDGTLSIMVGGGEETFARIRPLLACMAAEITHCGGAGAGQAVKLLNNMVVAMTVVALAEALSAARASGAVDGRVLFETLARSSADSFVLRNHGMKCLLTGEHPTEGAFPTDYILKDLGYALDFAKGAGVEMRAANVARTLMERTRDAGFAKNYYTAVIETLGRPGPGRLDESR